MDLLLMLLLLLWSSGLQAEDKHQSTEPVRLVGGASHCAGTLEVKQGEWRPVRYDFFWTLKEAAVACRELDCGSAVSIGSRDESSDRPVWRIRTDCLQSGSALRGCASSVSSSSIVEITCSEPVRLVGGASRCAGTLEVKRGEWRPVSDSFRTLKAAAVDCRELDCGSAVSIGSRDESSRRPAWWIRPDCLQSGSALRECVESSDSSSYIVELTCSDLLLQPIISVSPTMDGVSGAQQQGFQVLQGSNFTISCSVQPQYPGGSFQITFTSSNTTYNYTQPAVNHSADFLFPAADPAHQGSYSCVYGVYVFSHNFSSESRLLSLTVTDPDETFHRTVLIIRLVVVLPVALLLSNTALYFILKVLNMFV
ncbi:scavenger receptor cysteine-rich type 1 protein M130-like isoform X2 [Scomber scombrus]|uniref:scavenger receptor cysteine-rich type 1 protein M130-like isoform X2 n=1 Tax=Scomber scombrus TaxID=13677 RepID=UPI002DD8E00C|nr:scavenger receptor cysteine-rich type 1 protein M130-like isoform X2 [Scomber scombrus]